METLFEWDVPKAVSNLAKHGVSFDEAPTVFADPLARTLRDEDHSWDERREILVGHSAGMRLLVVCFTERDGEVIRIFSAREATRRERENYEKSTYS